MAPASEYRMLVAEGQRPVQRWTSRRSGIGLSATAHRLSSSAAARAQARDHRSQTRAKARPQTLLEQVAAQQILPWHGPQPPEGLARALDVCRRPRRSADQQPRRAIPARSRHLPQAKPRKPIPARRGTHRRLLSASITCRLQHRQPCTPTSSTCSTPAPAATPPHSLAKNGHGLNAYFNRISVQLVGGT